jgi:hypothetical protein
MNDFQESNFDKRHDSCGELGALHNSKTMQSASGIECDLRYRAFTLRMKSSPNLGSEVSAIASAW